MTAVKSQTDQLASITKAFKEVKEGDTVALNFVEGGTRVTLNGQTKGTIPAKYSIKR